VYVNGGSGATYPQDFVELHNRGATPVNITNWSIQYASSTGSSWGQKVNLTASVTLAPGQYYLVQTSSTTASSLNADINSGSAALGGAAGKVALVSNTTALTGNCPIGAASLIDLVGYGSQLASNGCWETLPAGGTAPAQLATTASIRKNDGCQDTGDNSADFSNLPVSPRRSSSTPVVCPGTTLNEFNTGEIDYCNVQFPTSMTKPTGTVTDEIFTQIYEFGLTEAAGPGTGLIVQIGYGPTNVNPEYQSGWIWSAATFNTQIGNNDEWKGTFTAPAAGTWNYGARVSLDGFRWTYCDLNGAGSNGGLSFETNQLPVLTVTP
jgi:hypothetical protein